MKSKQQAASASPLRRVPPHPQVGRLDGQVEMGSSSSRRRFVEADLALAFLRLGTVSKDMVVAHSSTSSSTSTTARAFAEDFAFAFFFFDEDIACKKG